MSQYHKTKVTPTTRNRMRKLEEAGAATGTKYFTVAEAARILGVSRSTLTRAIDRGDIPTERIGAWKRIPATAMPDLEAQEVDRELEAKKSYYSIILLQREALRKEILHIESDLAVIPGTRWTQVNGQSQLMFAG